jgi:hypothetical protein
MPRITAAAIVVAATTISVIIIIDINKLNLIVMYSYADSAA